LSRLRATVSPTDTDREIQRALDRAAREIEVALRMASESPLARNHKRRAIGELRRALDSVSRVSYLGSPSPEREPYENWKARQDQKRLARLAARNARREQADG
jgi:hypothetical protein